jgi:signal transduction histidine kinase
VNSVVSRKRRLVRLTVRLAGVWVAAGLLAAFCPPAIAAEGGKNVLVLYSYSRILPAVIDINNGLRTTILASTNRPIAVFDEFLDMPRFGGPAYSNTIVTYLREKYASQPPDVIVVGAEDALRFLLVNRAKLFPQVPVVHMAVPVSSLRSIPPLPDDVVGVPVEYDFSRTIEQARRWHPNARRLVIVTGAAATDRAWEAQLRDAAPRFGDRAEVEFLAGLPTDALLKRLSGLGGDAVVFTTGYFQDGGGRKFTPHESVLAMASAATAPVYAPFYTFMGTGIVGGFMSSYEAMGRQAGRMVNELIDGAAPASLRFPELMPTNLNVDWRQVRRWGIDEKAVPGDAVVHFREPTFLETHRNALILAAVVFLLQAALIGSLLFEHRRRRVAELAEQGHRSKLAHASRLAIAGELAGSIAHEINQPLGAILSNADAADLMLESGTDRRDELRAILADIRRDDLRASEVIRRLRALLTKQQFERQPFDLNETMRDVGSVLRAEARRRRVALDIRPAAASVTMVCDQVQIQQVLINLVLNAMDAVDDLPEDRRRIVVSIERVAGGIDIAVRDRGQGIAAEHVPKIFDSFFTTKRKGMGLGLSIARTLVEAHGGRIRVESRPGEGTAFHVELPAPDGTGVPSPAQA